MPTALDAGRYTSNGCSVADQRQYVRATGFPDPSICASAARNSAVIVGVACVRNSGAYASHVSAGVLFNVPLTGKNSSVGFFATWYVQFTPNQAAAVTTIAS